VPSDIERFVLLLNGLTIDNPPKSLGRAQAIVRLQAGDPVDVVVRELNVPRRHLLVWSEAVKVEGLHAWLGKPPVTAERIARARAGLAQMLVGSIAEEHFEAVSQQIVGREGYRIQDERIGRTDTDYRLVAADGHAICRFNVKFHGTAFVQARAWVNLEPDDCFALATYKIDAALRKQDIERLPFVFLVISVLNVPRSAVQESISDDWAWLSALSGRDVEEAIVKKLGGEPWVDVIRQHVRSAQFRVISARRAYQLMRDKLFERVHALKVRGFNRFFRNAEIDMHLSLSSEMIGFDEFLEVLVERGPLDLAVRLDRGEI
jgi:hypothetical protein